MSGIATAMYSSEKRSNKKTLGFSDLYRSQRVHPCLERDSSCLSLTQAPPDQTP